MNPLKTFCVVACLVAAVCATPSQKDRNNYASNSLKPTDWLSKNELETIPSLDEITLQRLENMPAEEGAKLMEKVYHLSQINKDLNPTFEPSPSNIPTYLVKANGQNVNVNLNKLVETVKEQKNKGSFGDEEITIFITGLPEQLDSVAKANKKLVEAYMKRNNKQQKAQQNGSEEKKNRRSSSEESGEKWNESNSNNGGLIVIDLGATITTFKRLALLDIERTGAMIGNVLVELTNECDVPQEIIHIVAQGIASHVAGAAGRQYIRLTGHQLRRITALDPSKIFAKNPNTLTSLARGDAEFVDAIHTSAYGMGTSRRVGDVDFYPNGPSASAPGAENVIAASMRATRYFAESVRPGNERNFPAVAASSMKQYQNNNGYGKRTYMGIDTDFDLKGNYMLQVNPSSPFGQRAPAHKQTGYHGLASWKNE